MTNPISPKVSLEKHLKAKGALTKKGRRDLFIKAFELRDTPREQQVEKDHEAEATAYVKIFDPAGGQIWYVLEWDKRDSIWVWSCGETTEFTHITLSELVDMPGGLGNGLNIDVLFRPTIVGSLPS